MACAGVFADGGHNICGLSPAVHGPFDVWIFWLPSARGMMFSDFDVAFPSGMQVMSTLNNPSMVTMGCGCREPGYPEERATALTDLNLYRPCVYALGPTSGGAIKGLFH